MTFQVVWPSVLKHVIELPDKPRQRWDEYLDAELGGTRSQKLGSLNRFIASLLELPTEIWRPWAIEFCQQHELKQLPVAVRQPLFEHVLFPALVHAWQSGTPGSLRLLAGFFDRFNNSRHYLQALPNNLQSRDALLKEELRQNPDDVRAGRMLASSMAQYAAHTLHELPSGVLYAMDGATLVECQELIEFLGEFRDVVTRFEVADVYRELFEDVSFHYNAYLAYLLQENRIGGYEEFLRSYEAR